MYIHMYLASYIYICCCCTLAQLCPTLCDPHRLQHARLPCPSPSPRVCSNSCPLNWRCHPTISPSHLLSLPFPASESFPMSQLLASGGQMIGASAAASVLPMNIQGWFPLRLTGLVSLQSKGFSRVFPQHMNLSKPWEIMKDRGAWWAAVHGVTKSRTVLSRSVLSDSATPWTA